MPEKFLTFKDNLGITRDKYDFKSILDYNRKKGIHYRPHTKVELFTNVLKIIQNS